VFLTSTVGASAAGLRRLKKGDAPTGRLAFEEWLRQLPDNESRAVRAHVKPLPADISTLSGWPTSALDVSDGLLMDAHRLAKASQVALELDALENAIDPAATLEDALGGGEDDVLLFTAPIVDAPPADVIRIGRVVEGAGVWSNGKELPPQGYDHFRS
jgi:thiamine-monophosphate kinase